MPRVRAWAWAAALATVLVASQGSAANLVEVRVGRHAEFTRVVLETDAPTRYELVGEGEGELRVRLFANAAPRRLGSKSSVLREVVIESDAAGAVARLALKKDAVRRREADGARQSAAHRPRPDPAHGPGPRAGDRDGEGGAGRELAKAEPAPQPVPEPGAGAGAAAEPAAEAAPAPEAEAETAPAPAERVAEAAPKAEAAAREAAPDAAGDELAARAARDAAAQAELDRLAGVVPMAEPLRRAAEEPAAQEAAGEPDAAAAGAGRGAQGSVRRGRRASPRLASRRARATRPTPWRWRRCPPPHGCPRAGPSASCRRPSTIRWCSASSSSLLGLVGALVVVRQRSARIAGAEASANPFAAADAFALAGAGAPGGSREAAEAWASGAAPDAAMGPLFANAAQRSAEAPAASIFDVAEEDAGRYEECTPPASSLVVVDSEEAAQGAASYQPEALEENVMRVVEELERRIAHLETRLEEVADAKERLERHVAAQTEELRVQRAAIARTQRVLRTIAKPDDLATEPTPKV